MFAASNLTSHLDLWVRFSVLGMDEVSASVELHVSSDELRVSQGPSPNRYNRNFSRSRSSRKVYIISKRKVVLRSLRIWGISYRHVGPDRIHTGTINADMNHQSDAVRIQ